MRRLVSLVVMFTLVVQLLLNAIAVAENVGAQVNSTVAQTVLGIEAANTSTSINVRASIVSGVSQASNYSSLFTGNIMIYENCKPPLLKISGTLVFYVSVYEAYGQDVPPDSQYRAEYSKEVASAIANTISGRTVRGWFLLMRAYTSRGTLGVFGSFSDIMFDLVILGGYGISGGGVVWNSSIVDAVTVFSLMAPMQCKVLNARTGTSPLSQTMGLGTVDVVIANVECWGVIPPGKYIGLPILYFDLNDMGIGCLYDAIGECITDYNGLKAIVSNIPMPYPFIPSESQDYEDALLFLTLGIGAGWVEFGNVATQTFEVPLSVTLPVVGLANLYGGGNVIISPPSSPRYVVMSPLLSLPVVPASSNVDELQPLTTVQHIGAVTIVIPSLSCTNVLSYDIGSGTISPGGPGSQIVIPGAGLGNYSLGRVEVPHLKPSDVLTVPSLDTPAGVLTAIGLFTVWMALASTLGLSIGTAVAMIIFAIYGKLAGSGILVIGGAIGFLLALLYHYLTGSA